MSFPLTIDHLLWRMRHVHPDARVLDVVGSADGRDIQSMTFAGLADRVRALSAGLARRAGVAPGSTVVTMSFNTRVQAELMFAVPAAGARLECLNVRMSSDVLLEQIASSDPVLVVVDREVLDHPGIGPVAAEVVAQMAPGIHVLRVDSRGGPEYDEIIATGETASGETPVVDENVPAFVFHSSGTTGRPKAYEVSHRELVLHSLSQAADGASGLTTTDRVLPLAPFFHVNGWGLLFTSTMTGADVVLIGGDLAPGRIADVMSDLGVTVAAAVPTVWHDVCGVIAQSPERRPARLREVLSGGSAVPQSVVGDIERHLGATVATAWGMTETMACSTYERSEPATTAGRPIPLMEMRIAGPAGPADAGEPGSLEVRGAFVIGAASDDGWMSTGDIASLDARGRLTLHDREKDMIKSGGEWIPSAEIELCLCEITGVQTAAVVARPDARWVERPVAFVVLDPAGGAPIGHEVLRAHLQQHLPRWWVPDEITIIDDLPKTAVGKIDKVALRRAQHAETKSEEMA
ncbi:AMP-binding protein [Aeromicrobium sp. YIM 150415]|uniref:AMP-binding protein n=1 Tax=Aeromicrobium sp. YIM 150415 TaxID=2803912 RepID=UPI00196283B0|nr:AMP-binding protein [Aeromicrobium sp. YIM 150415]MBM9465362.1 AMP-binding protein [Aeromicrobium sp. YIM 150415]